MKIKLIVASFFLTLALVSCKKEDNKGVVAPVEEVKANTFDVAVELVIKKDDELILFYKDPSINYFDEKNTVYYGLKGKKESQTVIFSIPEGVLPNDIRFDISSKKEQEPVKINAITLSFEGRTFRVDQKDLLKYFTPNEFITFDEASSTATFILKGDQYDPIFNTKPAIYVELEKVRGVKL